MKTLWPRQARLCTASTERMKLRYRNARKCVPSACVQQQHMAEWSVAEPGFFFIYIIVKLQLGFNPVAVVQQYNRQVTQITHKVQTQYKNTINYTTTANINNTSSYNKNYNKYNKTNLLNHQFSLHFTLLHPLHFI
jgi:hypothetical protein